MTSEIRGNKEVAAPQPIPDEPGCLCCLHFAVDFDVMPEARKRKYNWDRRSQVLVKKL